MVIFILAFYRRLMNKIVKFKPRGKRKFKLPDSWQRHIRKPKQPRIWQGALTAALIGTLIGIKSLDLGGMPLSFLSTSPALQSSAPVSTQSAPICGDDSGATCVVDGDTIHVAGERIRLLGIDAPELPGHCAIGRNCAPGDPFASTNNLARLMGIGPLDIQRVGTDRFGRTLALVKAGDVDLSCGQLRGGFAIYKPQWDNGGRLAARCPGI